MCSHKGPKNAYLHQQSGPSHPPSIGRTVTPTFPDPKAPHGEPVTLGALEGSAFAACVAALASLARPNPSFPPLSSFRYFFIGKQDKVSLKNKPKHALMDLCNFFANNMMGI